MSELSLEYPCLQGGQEEDGTAYFRPAACVKLPLSRMVKVGALYGTGNGVWCSTCWQTFEQALKRTPSARCLGHRPLDRNGIAGPYMFQSYTEVGRVVTSLARSMLCAGVKHGSRVCIYGVNCPEWVEAMLSCSAMGAVCVPLYDSLTLGDASAVAYILTHSGAEVVFVQDTKLGDLVAAIETAASGVHWSSHAAAGQPSRASASHPDLSPAGPLLSDPLLVKVVVVWGGAVDAHVSQGDLSADQERLAAQGVKLMSFVTFQRFWLTSTLPPPAATTAPQPGVNGNTSAPAEIVTPDGSVGPVVGPGIPQPPRGGPTCGAVAQQLGGATGRALDASLHRPGPEDLAAIYYTSGTTGRPKGVMLTHRALISVVASQLTYMQDPWGEEGLAGRLQEEEARVTAADRAGGREVLPGIPAAEQAAAEGHPARPTRKWPCFQPDDAHLSYLPLAHIYERSLVEGAFALGAAIGFWQGKVDCVQDDAAALAPTLFVGVPRVWERVREGVAKKLAARTPIARALFKLAYWQKLRRIRAGVPQDRACRWGDALVFRKVSAALGGKVKIAVSGAAPLPLQLEEFMRTVLCAYAGQGYGLTETCSATCVAWPDRPDMIGTVGPVQTCAEFRLAGVPDSMGYDPEATWWAPKGELLVRGPCLFSGYYRDEQATAEVMENGWFHTGDIVELMPSGALRIIDRKKNLVKLAQGEYIAVEAVETTLRGHLEGLVTGLWVHGEPTERRLVAVAVPHPALVKKLQSSIREPEGSVSEAGSLSSLCSSPAARALVLKEVLSAAKAAGLTSLHTPAAVHLEPVEWTPESGVMTPTLKLRRAQMRSRYADAIASMYASLKEGRHS